MVHSFHFCGNQTWNDHNNAYKFTFLHTLLPADCSPSEYKQYVPPLQVLKYLTCFRDLLQTLRYCRPTQCRIDNFVQTVIIKWWTQKLMRPK